VRASRWRCREGELDLVVDMPGEIVFVEVKARRGLDAETVTARQWARIGAAASRYLAEETDGSRPCRFDLVLVDRAGHAERIVDAARFDDW
jgi:putative endonuclease